MLSALYLCRQRDKHRKRAMQQSLVICDTVLSLCPTHPMVIAACYRQGCTPSMPSIHPHLHPCTQCRLRYSVRNAAQTMRMLCCIHPVAHSWRMPASTSGNPVLPRCHALSAAGSSHHSCTRWRQVSALRVCQSKRLSLVHLERTSVPRKSPVCKYLPDGPQGTLSVA